MIKDNFTRKEVEAIFDDFERMLFKLDEQIFGTGRIPPYFYSIKAKHLGKDGFVKKFLRGGFNEV